MCCGEILKSFYEWVFEMCNGSLYSIDEDDRKGQHKNYSDYEMKKKDLVDDNPFIIEIEKNINSQVCEDKEKNLLQEIIINEYLHETLKSQIKDKNMKKEIESNEWDVMEN
jgi:hypothetical protein